MIPKHKHAAKVAQGITVSTIRKHNHAATELCLMVYIFHAVVILMQPIAIKMGNQHAAEVPYIKRWMTRTLMVRKLAVVIRGYITQRVAVGRIIQ